MMNIQKYLTHCRIMEEGSNFNEENLRSESEANNSKSDEIQKHPSRPSIMKR